GSPAAVVGVVEAPGEGLRRVAARLLAAVRHRLAARGVVEAAGEGLRRVAARLLAAGAGHLAAVVAIEAPGEGLRRVAPRLLAAGADDRAAVVAIEAPGEGLRRVAPRLLAAGADDRAAVVTIEARKAIRGRTGRIARRLEWLRRVAARLLAAGAGDRAGVVIVEALEGGGIAPRHFTPGGGLGANDDAHRQEVRCRTAPAIRRPRMVEEISVGRGHIDLTHTHPTHGAMQRLATWGQRGLRSALAERVDYVLVANGIVEGRGGVGGKRRRRTR